MATFMVTNNADSGEGTLREAILLANQNPGADLINFNLPANHLTIRPTQELPFLQDEIQIDGTSQPGYDGQPVVKLDGSLITGSPVSGLPISGSNCSVIGLHIFNFDFGILLTGGSNNTIAKNAIGGDPRGQTNTSNRMQGVYVYDSSSNQIGGPNAGNLISGNGDSGIRINGTSSHNKVQGNLIGTNASGTAAYGAQKWGVLIYQGGFNTIGVDGDEANDDKEANLISGNSISGVRVDSGTSNIVAGNTIGLSLDQVQPITTQDYGIEVLVGATKTQIGSNADFKSDFYERNIVSSNRIDGVVVWNATQTTIQGNWIGLSGDGLSARGNGASGIRIDNSSNFTQVGSQDAENFIAGNGQHGIIVWDSTNIQLSRNMIGYAINLEAIPNGLSGIYVQNSTNVMAGGLTREQGNYIEHDSQRAIVVNGNNSRVVFRNNRFSGTTPLAIDIGDNGETANDLRDADSGPNQLQNSPVVQAAYVHNVSPMVAGSINSTPLTKLTIEVLTITELKPGSSALSPEKIIEVMTDQNGYASWSTTLDTPLAIGQSVVAIASQSSIGSSELSNRLVASPYLQIDLSQSTLTEAGGSLVATVHRAFGDSTNSPLVIDLTSNSQFSSRISIPDSVTIPAGSESVSFSVTANDDSYYGMSSIALIANSARGTGISEIALIDNDSPWHNYLMALDVNSSGNITPTDALLIINYLNAGGIRVLNQISPPFPPVYFDTVMDGRVSPSDALAVINYLNARASGEAEATSDSAMISQVSDHLEILDELYSYFDEDLFGGNEFRTRQAKLKAT